MQARTAVVEVAQSTSEHCGQIQKDAEDLAEAWETRCLGEGIVWTGVSLGTALFVLLQRLIVLSSANISACVGATHTCALAKDDGDAKTGALCCWGSLSRYDSNGRFSVMKPDEKYEYHGTTPGEGESIFPAAIMHRGYDATIDTLQCEVSH